jgi:serine/threonine protein phosphatase PrpC
VGLRCPRCGRAAAPDDRFCEVDGTPLTLVVEAAPGPLLCACGLGQGSDSGDGYCERCGMLMRPLPALDLSDDDSFAVSAPASDLASATHRGTAHIVDEDSTAVARRELEAGPVHVLVVCDGVSSSAHGEQASARAAQAALEALIPSTGDGAAFSPAAALRQAVRAAHRAACAPGIGSVAGKGASGTTLVAAVAHAGQVDVAWVGDSRAYLLPDRLLTHDHSWVNQVVDSGELTAAEAASSPDAHALTRCLGPLENADPERPPEPSLATASAAPGTRLVVCSDGVWNSAPSPAELAALTSDLPPTADARAMALCLVRRAAALGGRDDVTAAVALL